MHGENFMPLEMAMQCKDNFGEGMERDGIKGEGMMEEGKRER